VDGDDPGRPSGDPDDEGPDDADRIRGWISPDDRLWRHPSEASSAPGARHTREISLAAHHPRGNTWVVGGTTVALILALVAIGLIIVTTDTNESSSGSREIALTRAPTTEAGTGRLESPKQMAAVVAAVRPSTVALIVVKRSGTVIVTGLVAESGGVVVTTASPLAGASDITVVEPGGSRPAAAVLGVDPTSDLAVVRIGDDLPAATFDEDDPAPGDLALTLAMEPAHRAGGTPAARVYAGTVLSSGRSLTVHTGGADFAPTAVATPLTARDLGSPLLDSTGDVAGLLDEVDRSGGVTTSVFLPAEIVLGVVRQLVATGTVDHGWLGIQGDGADATATTSALTATTVSPAATTEGAPVATVESGSPAAAAGLEPGDMVVALDGNQVHSMAELRAWLYAEPPGTALAVTFERDGAVENTTVVLGDATDAPGDGTSP
jgi:S1-C subfamily serine protease